MIERLLWASPWNATSAIARFGMDVIMELERAGIRVDVIRTEIGDFLGDGAPPPATGQVFEPGSLNYGEILFRYDAMIANFGDHYGFHGALLPMLGDTAPIGIFHDAWMGNLLAGWRHYFPGDVRRLDHMISDLGADPSGLSAIASMCSGGIVHGPHYRGVVEAGCPGPVTAIPLAYRFDPIPPPNLQGDHLVVATVGHINPNKRVDQVLQAIGFARHLRRKVTYVLAGPVGASERQRLCDVAGQWNAPIPMFTGWIPEDELREVLTRADVICCLRDPCLEGGSASLVTALLSSRPTLVSDHAHYAVLPDEVVMKCSIGNAAADVIAHLEHVLEAPAEARALGERGRDYALVHHTPKAYATRLTGAIETSVRAAPLVRAARRLGATLSWTAAQPNDPVVARAGDCLDKLVPR